MNQPTTLDELFSRDPRKLSDAEIETMVAEFRRKRADWLVSESQPKAPRAAKAKVESGTVELKLEDLG